MKLSSIISLLPVLASCLFGDVYCIGIASVGGKQRVMLQDSDAGGPSGWLIAGDVFAGTTIQSIQYDAGIVVLSANGALREYRLVDPRTLSMGSAPAEDLNLLTEEELLKRGIVKLHRGETGLKIAKNNGIALADLRALNPTVNFAKLHVGDFLRIKK